MVDETRREHFMQNEKNSCLRLFLDCRPILVRVHPPHHRHRRTRQVHHQVHLQVQHQSEVTSSHQETVRAIHQNPKQKIKIILQQDFGRPFARSSRMAEGVHRKSRRYKSACAPHTFLMTRIRKACNSGIQEAQFETLTSQKNEIAMCACEPR